MDLLVATSNSGKLREIRELLSDLPIALLSLADFPGIETVAETGLTFGENAALKATGYAKQTGVLTLADDSGLAVDALDGAPGVHSARFLGEHATYEDRIKSLLSSLTGAADRTARFTCAIAIAKSAGDLIFTTQAACEGEIAESPRGSQGFGYDPVFIPEGLSQTFGELPAHIKNQISHRGRALTATHRYIASLTVSRAAG